MIAAREQEDGYHHGPAPVDFEKDDRHQIEGREYDRVAVVLDMVREEEFRYGKLQSK